MAVKIFLACTGMPGAITGATLTQTSVLCYDPAAWNNPRQPIRIPSVASATAFALGKPEVFWDIENDVERGGGIDPRTCRRSRARNNLKRLRAFLTAVGGAVPGCQQWVYRAFPASLSNAANYSPADIAKWNDAIALMRDTMQPPPAIANIGLASTDLYTFGQMETWTQGQIEAAVDANVLKMREYYPAPQRLQVFVCSENHPGSSVNPMQDFNNQRWQWFNARLASYAYVDVVLWGGYATANPWTPRTWANYSASANWATFKTVWGLP